MREILDFCMIFALGFRLFSGESFYFLSFRVLKIAASDNLIQSDLESRVFKTFDATESCAVPPERREQAGAIIGA